MKPTSRTFLILAFSLLLSGGVAWSLAAGQKGGGGGKGGGKGDAVAFPDTMDVQWASLPGGNGVNEDVVRACTLSTSSATYASYHCPHGGSAGGPGGQISISLTSGQQVARKGDASLCPLLDGMTVEPNSNYQIDWDCGTVPCVVRILNVAFGQEVIDSTAGASSMLLLEAFANSEPNWPTNLMGEFSRIDVTFKANGTNKTNAICRFEASLEGVAHNQVPTP